MHHITEAHELIAPFIGARLNRSRNADGYLIPRTEFVDICTAGVAHIDADIRAVTDKGVELCVTGGFVQTIAWEDIREIRVSAEGRPDRVLCINDEPDARAAESYVPFVGLAA